MAAFRMKRFWAKLGNLCDPVALGQTRGGLVLAVVLIAGWQLSATAYGQSASGYSENDYFRLEWEYELDQGRGVILLRACGDGAWPWTDRILDRARFTTAGLTFDSITDDSGAELFSPPTYVGNEDGRPLYEYDLLNPIWLGDWQWGDEPNPVNIHVRYPDQGVELRATELSYRGYLLSGVVGPVLPIPPGEMPFVTIQTIPEPSACATLGLGAAALAAALRRRDRA